MVGMLLPLMLILIFGYGLSFDVKNMPVAIVMEDASPTAADAVSGLYLSPYFTPLPLTSMHVAEKLMMEAQKSTASCICTPISRAILPQAMRRIQVLVNGVDANRARVMLAYAQGAIAQWGVRRAAAGEAADTSIGSVVIDQRIWFNEANTSTWFLVPGLIVLIMTLIGALLTSLVMAREWERGTLEALFVTPVRATEILIAKIVPYFCVGLIGLALCLLAARLLFAVPIRGSLLADSARLDAVSAGRARHRAAHLRRNEESVSRSADFAHFELSAGADAVRLHLRPAEFAGAVRAVSSRAARHVLRGSCCKRCSSPAMSGRSS